MGESISEFLGEHERGDFPDPFGPWKEEEDFDPRFLRETIRRAEKLKWIEVDRADPNNWKYRFTILGTQAFENHERWQGKQREKPDG